MSWRSVLTALRQRTSVPMGDMHPSAQLVMSGFQAFAEGDMATMKELLADNVAWHTSGRSKFSGSRQGVDAVLQFFGEVLAYAQIEQELHAILADDEHVVVLVNSKATRGDDTLDAETIFVFHVNDGKVTECGIFIGFDYAADAFWG